MASNTWRTQVCVLVLVSSWLGRCVGDSPSTFVYRNGTHFMLDGKRFYFNGFNAYWLMAEARGHGTRENVDAVMAHAQALGLTVCRTWAFWDGEDGLQTAPGVFSEEHFEALDYVLFQARWHGLRVVLAFVNQWEDYGGRAMYLKWARDNGVADAETEDDFFTNPTVRQYLKDAISTIANRQNTYTGTLYKDDPTILAWDLMNEPRSGDVTGDVMQHWVAEMAQFVKAVDPNHLVTIGTEGFYGASTPERVGLNPWKGINGSDFVRHHNNSNIDFASMHLYLHWLEANSSLPVEMEFTRKWVAAHLEDCAALNKPLVIEEFAYNSNVSFHNPTLAEGQKNRRAFYQLVYNLTVESVASGGPAVGAIMWQLAYPGDVDPEGYNVYEGDETLTTIIVNQSAIMTRLAGYPKIPVPYPLASFFTHWLFAALTVVCILGAGIHSLGAFYRPRQHHHHYADHPALLDLGYPHPPATPGEHYRRVPSSEDTVALVINTSVSSPHITALSPRTVSGKIASPV